MKKEDLEKEFLSDLNKAITTGVQITATEVLRRSEEWANSPEVQDAVKEFSEKVIEPYLEPLLKRCSEIIAKAELSKERE